MTRTGKLIRHVQRRLRLRLALARLEPVALLAAAALFVFALATALMGRPLSAGECILAELVVLGGAALFVALRTRVTPARALAEADGILDTRERLSTAYALERGRAEDPLGFGPHLKMEAEESVRAARPEQIRSALPVRLRSLSLVTLALLVGLLFVGRLAPVATGAAAAESPAERKERERVEEALRRLDRKIARTQAVARQRDMEELKKLTLEIRKEASRLADAHPTRAKAIARMSDLERTTRDQARRFAGLPKADPQQGPRISDHDLADLSAAIRNFLAADPRQALDQLSTLVEKLKRQGASGTSPEQVEKLAKALERLRRATAGMEGLTGRNSPAGRALGDMLTPEQSERMANALSRLAEAMKKGEGVSKAMKELLEGSDYRGLQPSATDIDQAIRNLEQLAKMIESGQDLANARGAMGGVFPMPGLGTGSQGLQIGGAGQGSDAAGSERGDSPGTGGPGTGHGGRPAVSPDDRKSLPEFDPGRLNDEGKANFFRTIRRVPSAHAAPREYQEVMRAASRDAEEAIRRGEIPRRYRGYVRRFFGTGE